MNKTKKSKRYAGMVFLALLLGMTGCGTILETASERFDDVVGNLFATGQDSFEEDGKVTIRILTATPVPGPTDVPTPTLSPTPTPLPDDVEPAGETVDEWVYAASSVNIRSSWTTNSLILGSLNKNDMIHRIAVLENGWSKVSYNTGYAYINSDYLTTSRPGVVGTVHIDTNQYSYNAVMSGDDVMLLDVKNILQKPDLPTGAEITCLTIVLNYLGDYADKVYMAENYLTIAEPGTTSPYEAYLGDPKTSSESYGCYAPVIVDAANRYFSDKGESKKQALDVSGSSIDELLAYVKKGMPVIVWGTINMTASSKTTEWQIEDFVYRWREKSHCTVLIGYNKTKSTVIVADPLQGIVEYDMDTYYQRYKDLLYNAVVISSK